MSRVRENRMHGSMGGGWNRSVATVTGSGRPAETPGLCAGPTAVQRHRASSLPDRHHRYQSGSAVPYDDVVIATTDTRPPATGKHPFVEGRVPPA